LKLIRLAACLLMISVLFWCLSGCKRTGGDGVRSIATSVQQTQMSSTGQATPESTALHFSPTPIPTIMPLPSPSIMLTPTSKPLPSPTINPTPMPTSNPTSAPTPKPTSASGTIVVADGFSYRPLDAALKKRITGISYPANDPDCQIRYEDLRYIQLRHYNFEGQVSSGELIVHAKLAREVTEIFLALYQAKYPLTSVHLVDDYGEPHDDTKSMEANNTSAFCYRTVTGSTTLSRHSLGAAIDINPMLNPYIDGDRVAPANGAPYVDRTRDFAGKIDHDDLCYKLFTRRGWSWGGDWSGDKDYQHFSKKIS